MTRRVEADITVDMADKTCRSRSAPFNLTESKGLCSVISIHKNIIESKETNENNNQDKTAVWVMVTQEYNALGLGPQRFPQGLLNRWKLMKKNARKEKSFERKDMCKTGGGLPATRKRLLHPSLVDVVLGIISELSVEGDKNSFDSNAG